MMKLRINPLVAVDLKVIRNFIAEDNDDKALETITRILETEGTIEQKSDRATIYLAEQKVNITVSL